MRTVVLNNIIKHLEEDGIYNPIKKSTYEEMGGTYELCKDQMLYPTFNII